MSPAERPPGLLRVFTIYHEAHSLGAGTSFLRVTEQLEAFGWTASGWVPAGGDLRAVAGERLALVLGAEKPLAYSVRGWREKPGIAVRAFRTPRYLREFRSALERARPHVVHANTLLSLPEAALARRCGLPVVLQAHEMPPSGLKTALAARYAAGVADVLVGVSDAVCDMLRRHAGRTPVATVRNGVPDTPLRRRTADGPLTVGCLGTVSRTKGTDVFLRAARLALDERPDLHFEHAGAPDLHRDAGFDDELAELVEIFDRRDAVVLLGARPSAEVLARWDVLVLPSRSEGFPLSTLEAMAAGIPVIATTVGGVPEQIEHLRSGVLVRPDDPEAIASWLVRIHDDDELRQRLGHGGRARVRTEFTLERQAAGLHRAYLAALNRRFAPPRVRRDVRLAW
jgi:glycosyltransferase involved in cell wall biosynthesis